MAKRIVVAILLLGLGLVGFVRPHADASTLRSTGPMTVTKVERLDTKLNRSPTGRPTLMADEKPFFPIGVTYHFTRHRGQWDDDLRLMRAMGLNTVRADMAWRDIVPYLEGNYQFGILDEFMDKAAANGLYVVPVFSYATLDYNTPWWFWAFYQGWGMVGADGAGPWGDYPSINHPDYQRLLKDYIRETVKHIRNHPATLAYQILNEPHYPKRPLSDYSDPTVSAFRAWSAQQFRSIDLLNKRWLLDYRSFDEIQPPREAVFERQTGEDAGSAGEAERWSAWREFAYYNLSSFVEELAETVRREDPYHAILVSEMSWWWWGEQPTTGVSPAHIYSAADVVGFDVYPEGGKHADYYGLNADLLYRLWERPVWVTELNRKDGNPTSAEIKGFTARAVERGATGVFYFQWRDTWSDGGAYGLLDARGNPKKQFSAFEATVDWLTHNAERLLSNALPTPDTFLIWPSQGVATIPGQASPAHEVYRTALRLSQGGLRVGLIPEELAPVPAPKPRQEIYHPTRGAR